MSCQTKCLSVDDVLALVARQLSDYDDTGDGESFVTWSRAALTAYYNEATQMLVANRPDAYAEVIDMKLVPGSIQTIPDGYRAFVKVELNIDKNGAQAEAVIAGDEYFSKIMSGKACLASQCIGAGDEDYVVRSFSVSSTDPTQFTVSPPVPVGTDVFVKVMVAKSPGKVCASDGESCVDFDPVFAPAVVEWMLYRAWGSDAEIVGGTNAATAHGNMFFRLLGVQLAREQQFLAGTLLKVGTGKVAANG